MPIQNTDIAGVFSVMAHLPHESGRGSGRVRALWRGLDNQTLEQLAGAAHAIQDFGHQRHVVGQGIRWWLKAREVLITRTLAGQRRLFRGG